MAYILTGPDDMDAVRSVALGLLGSNPARAQVLLPDATIQQYSILGRAEMQVITSIGPDWRAILAGTAPSQYAGGDAVMARQLLLDATVMYVCANLCNVLRQLVPTMEKSEIISVTRDLTWSDLQTDYIAQAGGALHFLLPVVPAPAMVLGVPAVQPSDPAFDPQSVPPLFATDQQPE